MEAVFFESKEEEEEKVPSGFVGCLGRFFGYGYGGCVFRVEGGGRGEGPEWIRWMPRSFFRSRWE